jgi:hypothetical protein
MSAPAGGRPSRTRRLRSARGSDLPPLAEKPIGSWLANWDLGGCRSLELSLSLSCAGRRLKNRQIIVLSCNNYRSPCVILLLLEIFSRKQNKFFFKLNS